MKRRTIIPYDPKLKLRARELRNRATRSEKQMWRELKGRQVLGYDFHRQKPVDHFILDFFCSELMLGIEIDGYTHASDEAKARDRLKDSRMAKLGIRVLRFTDDEVFQNTDRVIERIKEFILQIRSGATHPLTPSEEGEPFS
jgi:very-short-patch-repair endonuclease